MPTLQGHTDYTHSIAIIQNRQFFRAECALFLRTLFLFVNLYSILGKNNFNAFKTVFEYIYIMAAKIPNVYNYNDFRKFLSDFQKAKRLADRRFTKSNICKQLGLPNSRSYFNDVLNGKPVSASYMERFVALCGFNTDQARFFRVLVKFNQADNPEERELYFEQLIALNKTPRKELDQDMYEYYSEWYHSAIRAALETFDFKDDYQAIVKRMFPPITEKKARDSIALLLRLGLIKKNSTGFFKATAKAIKAGPHIQEDLLKQYQLACLDNAKKALIQNNSMHQVFSTNTISISKEGYELLTKRLLRIKSEIRSLVHKDEKPADRVYQVNIQLFPNIRFKKG